MKKKYLSKPGFSQLFDALHKHGYSVVGPKVEQNAIVYTEICSPKNLPYGMTDSQSAGHYEIKQSSSQRYFSWANGPQAIKPLTFAPSETLWRSTRNAQGKLQFEEILPEVRRTAILGIRACDLAALKTQDAHFLDSDFVDLYYKKRRESLFLIAVNCSHPAETCFCASTGDGPTATDTADMILTELNDGFIVETLSAAADQVVRGLPLSEAQPSQLKDAETQALHSVKTQKKSLPQKNIQQILIDRQEHEHWDDIANRCLSCGNCTSVCPSCFCHSEHDKQALDGSTSQHVREWDSCFNQEHSYIHGIVIRAESKMRYRQWLTHKFSSWVEQYGRSGCSGCGRCITWCPVGIDVTEELAVLCGVDESCEVNE